MKNRIIIAGLGLVPLTLIGAGCAGTEVAETRNDSIEAENTNVVADVEVLDEGVGGNDNSDGEVASNVNEEDVEVAGDSEIDMSDWLTYRNEEYGFSFEYPSYWILLEDQEYAEEAAIPDELAIAGFDLNHSYDSNIGVKDVYVNVVEFGEGSLAEWFQKSALYTSSQEISNSSSEFKPNVDSVEIEIDGVQGIDQITTGEGGGMRQIFVLKNDVVYVFVVSSSNSYPDYRNPINSGDVAGYSHLIDFNAMVNTIDIK